MATPPRFIGNTEVSAVGLGGASWSFADYDPWVEATPHPVDYDLAIVGDSRLPRAARRPVHGVRAAASTART